MDKAMIDKRIFKFAGMVVILMLAACTPKEVVIVERSSTYPEDTEILAQKWDDAFAIANNTGRGQLAGPVAELQAIHREAQLMDSPTELVSAHGHLVAAMDAAIQGFLYFMAEMPDNQVDQQFDIYGNELATWTKLLIAYGP